MFNFIWRALLRWRNTYLVNLQTIIDLVFTLEEAHFGHAVESVSALLDAQRGEPQGGADGDLSGRGRQMPDATAVWRAGE